MFSILSDYSFWTVAIGTMLLALSSSIIGTISVLTQQSLIADSLGHASYPGVIFSFMIFQSRNPFFLMIGAVASGYLSYGLVYWMCVKGRYSLVNSLSLVMASFFGLGMVLKNYLQGNDRFGGSTKAGLQLYLFGQAAFIQLDDIFLICIVSVLCLCLFFIFYNYFKLYLFDRTFSKTVGIKVRFLRRLTMFLMICIVSVGLKVVGAILMSSFLISPSILGLLLCKNYHRTLTIAAFFSCLSAFIGTWISSVISGLSTGPSIIVCMTVFVLLAFVYVTYVKKENGRA